MRTSNRLWTWRRLRRPAGALGLLALALQLAPLASGACPAMGAAAVVDSPKHETGMLEHHAMAHQAAGSPSDGSGAQSAPDRPSEHSHGPSSPHCDFLAHCATAVPALQPTPATQVSLLAMASPAGLPWQLHTAWPQSLTPPPRA